MKAFRTGGSVPPPPLLASLARSLRSLVKVAPSLAGALSVALALALVGCKTESYCFADCAEDGGGGKSDGAAGDAMGIDASTGGSGGIVWVDSGDACVTTNNGVEKCDHIDNDCNGKVDDGIDFTSPFSCGTCETNCAAPPNLINPSCDPPALPDGTTPGTCGYEKCAAGFYDINKDPADGCEYHCEANPNGTNTVDTGGENGCGVDDDCDGLIDEDLNTCTDVENCGACGRKCVLAHATAKCVSTAGPTEQCVWSPGGTGNTECAIESCDAGYYDVDGAPGNGCEYPCPVATPSAEVCDGVDNDCDALIDNADPSLETDDPDVGDVCSGGTQGECAAASYQGTKKCIGKQITCCDKGSDAVAGTNPNFPSTGKRNNVCDDPACSTLGATNCVLKPGEVLETCNAKDDDCDGQVDDAPIDVGGACGPPSTGNCVSGTYQCTAGVKTCVGGTGPQPDVCNGQDDDCDDVTDGTKVLPQVTCTTSANCASGNICLPLDSNPTVKVCAKVTSDSGSDCDVPPPPPPGATQPCQKGTLVCTAAKLSCVGSIKPTSTTDKCGEDSNCDGQLTGQPNLLTDVTNCGTCGNNCNALGAHGVWACQSGVCVRTGCATGYINCDGNANDCEKSCTFVSSAEQCNGADDNCNCQVDEGVGAPSPTQVCGVSAAATDTGCVVGVGGVSVACTAGAWKCTFPAGYCTGAAPDYCSGTADICDGKDNNCNGAVDENFKPPVLTQGYIGQPCASDDGLPPPGHGACRGYGTYQCSGTSSTACNAVMNTSAAGPELCDNIDNDCDGSIDEPYTAKGTNATYWLKPAVTQIAASLWIYQYEASRPGATSGNPGSGNGYQTTAPAGTTLDKTKACSVPSVVPWFNVTPVEVAQTCSAMGGRVCTTTDWSNACKATVGCKWGYAPRGVACTTSYTNTKYCNLSPFDFDQNPTNGDQDGLLPTASSSLANCWADWAGLQGNLAAFDDIRDITGNLREISYNTVSSPGGCAPTSITSTCLFSLMGGSFNTQSESGATCDFSFFTVDKAFKLYDVGFRCCFDSKPD